MVEVVGQPAIELPPNLAQGVQPGRVRPQRDRPALPGIVRDLSTNGAFVATEPVPLMSRLAMQFEYDGQQIDALAWVLWQPQADCEVTGPSGTVLLPRGIGLLFESIPLEHPHRDRARVARYPGAMSRRSASVRATGASRGLRSAVGGLLLIAAVAFAGGTSQTFAPVGGGLGIAMGVCT